MNKIIVPPPHRRGITVQWTRMCDKSPEHGDTCLIIAEDDIRSWKFRKLDQAVAVAEYNAIDQNFDLLCYGLKNEKLSEEKVFGWAKFNLRAVDSFMQMNKAEAEEAADSFIQACGEDTEATHEPPVLKSNLDDVESVNIEDL